MKDNHENGAVSGAVKRYRKLRAAFVVTTISLLLLEVALRLLGVASPVLYESDPAAGYRLKPNQSARLLSNRIHINSCGIRDAREFAAKREGVTRILVLGDSVTWGGIREHQRNLFTSVLERKLDNAEVLNAGVNGYSVNQMCALYRTRLAELEPDMVLVHVIPRDFTRPPVTRLDAEHPAFPFEPPPLALSAACSHIGCLSRQRSGGNKPPQTGPEDENVTANLSALIELIDQMPGDVTVLISVSPYRADFSGHGMPPEVIEALAQRHVPILNVADSLNVDENHFVDHVHLSTAGHAAIAACLADWIEPLL